MWLASIRSSRPSNGIAASRKSRAVSTIHTTTGILRGLFISLNLHGRSKPLTTFIAVSASQSISSPDVHLKYYCHQNRSRRGVELLWPARAASKPRRLVSFEVRVEAEKEQAFPSL